MLLKVKSVASSYFDTWHLVYKKNFFGLIDTDDITQITDEEFYYSNFRVTSPQNFPDSFN